MAKLANTFVPSTAKANREELSDVVTWIDQNETPLLSSIGMSKRCKSVNPEWTSRPVRAAKANAQPTGNEYDFGAHPPSVRTGNKTQIFTETWSISGTQEAVDNAGKTEKVARAKLESGIQIKKDVELAIVTNTASAAGTTPVLGGLPTYLASNVDRGAGGANGGFDEASGNTQVATAGTKRAFTKAQLDDMLEQCFLSGAKVTEIHCSSYVKRQFSQFMADPNVAQLRTVLDKSDKPYLRGAVEVYMADHHTVTFVPNAIMSADAATSANVYALDTRYIDFCWLRPIKNDTKAEKLGTGDAHKGVILGEGTLKVADERAHGLIADVFGRSADVV